MIGICFKKTPLKIIKTFKLTKLNGQKKAPPLPLVNGFAAIGPGEA